MASGDTLLILTPYSAEFPAATFPQLYLRNRHPVLGFDAAADEFCIWTGIMPHTYAGGGVTIYIHLTDANDTNTAHASYWDVAFENDTAQDIDADGFAAVQSTHVHPNGTSGIPVIATIPFTDGAQMDSVAVGQLFRISVNRDANNGADDWANDAEVLAVEIKET